MDSEIRLTRADQLINHHEISSSSWCLDVVRQSYTHARNAVPVPEEYKDAAMMAAAVSVVLGLAARRVLLRSTSLAAESRALSAGVPLASSRLEYSIVPLTKENLPGAIKSVNESFCHGWPYLRPAKDLRASLEATGCPRTVASGELNARYWVALDRENRVLGTTGLYETTQDAGEAVWVGWLGVGNAYRGHGVGRALLNHTIETARAEGNQCLRLYTSNHRAESAAQFLYESVGLKIYRTEPHALPFSGLRLFYRELRLH